MDTRALNVRLSWFVSTAIGLVCPERWPIGVGSVNITSLLKMYSRLLPVLLGHLLASGPNKILAIDFTVLEPSSSGLENMLVMTDVFTK